MKKFVFILTALMMAAILVSCIELPDEPHEYLPWCKELYEEQLVADPEFPHAFVGACVSSLQTGKPTAFTALCRYEPFRDSLELGPISHKECIDYIHTLEE